MDVQLSDELRTLAEDRRVPLLGYADPAGRQESRTWVWLRSGCADLAAHPHETFGDRVDLRVGLLPFPLSRSRDDAPVAADVPPAPSWLAVCPVKPVLIDRDSDSVRVLVRLTNGSVQDALIVTGDATAGHVLTGRRS